MIIRSRMMIIISLTRALILDWLRSKTGVFFTILFPVMLMSILTMAFSGDGRYELYVQNLDMVDGRPSMLSKALIDTLESSNAFMIRHLPDGADAHEYAMKGKRVLIVPEGFDSSIRERSMEARMVVMLSTLDLFMKQPWIPDSALPSIESGREGLQRGLDAIRNGEGNRSAVLLLVVDSSRDREHAQVQGILNGIVAEFQQRSIDAPDMLDVEIDDLSNGGTGRANYYLPAVLAAFIMTNGVLGTSGIAAEFRRKGMLKRLMSTPLSRVQWILANMLTQTLLALMLASIMILIAVVAFKTQLPSAVSVGVLALGALCFTGLGMLIAGTLKDPHAITGASNAIAFPMMFLSGAFWPVDMMPEYMQHIAYIFPLTYFVDALNSTMYLSSMIDTIRSISVLLVFTCVFVLIGSILTRWKQE